MKLKKFLAIILTTITAACISVGFSGCKEEIKLPPMTETAPVVEVTYSEMDYYPIPEVYGTNNYHVGYYDFVKYYNGSYEQFGSFKQVCNKKFYFISTKLVEPEVQGWFYMWERICILVEKDSDTENGLVNPIINCDGSVTDNNIGIYREKGSNAPATIEFKAYFIPVDDGTEDNQLILKFGKIDKTSYYNYYINIYKSDICISTIYFHTEVSIPQEWFEDFFTRHLVYGG